MSSDGTAASGQSPPAASQDASRDAPAFHAHPASPHGGGTSRLPGDFGQRFGEPAGAAPESSVSFKRVRVQGATSSETEHAPGTTGDESGPQQAMQVHNRYLVAEIDNGLVVIDQHALHERVLYEQIRGKVLDGAMETQNLLVPEPVDLAPDEAAAVLEAQDLLDQLGVRVEPFGGDTLLISSYPAMLANWSPKELLRTLAEQLTSGGKLPDRRDLLDGLLHMISCKAAIKAGDRLTPEEVTALLEQRDLAQDAHHCPHGRPTALVFTCDELDKQFKRV
jgi:DNA mismatch repair protein MutL